jgi:hypothetical protein
MPINFDFALEKLQILAFFPLAWVVKVRPGVTLRKPTVEPGRKPRLCFFRQPFNCKHLWARGFENGWDSVITVNFEGSEISRLCILRRRCVRHFKHPLPSRRWRNAEIPSPSPANDYTSALSPSNSGPMRGGLFSSSFTIPSSQSETFFKRCSPSPAGTQAREAGFTSGPRPEAAAHVAIETILR